MSQFNFCDLIQRHIKNHPDRLALSVPSKWTDRKLLASEDISYREFGQRVTLRCQDLRSQGIKPGDRVVIFFPVNAHMIVLIVALFAIGATPTFIDPGMGLRKVIAALKTSDAKAFVTIPMLKLLKVFLPTLWPINFISHRSGKAVQSMISDKVDPCDWDVQTMPDDSEGIVTFTSGTTGNPKAANRTRRILQGQHIALSRTWSAEVNEVVLTCFPITCLFFICHGATCLLPAVDLKAPGKVKAEVILDQMQKFKVSSIFGAAAFLEKVVSALGKSLPEYKLRSVVSGGAPTPYRLVHELCERFPQCHSLVIYGSTEAEPIAFYPMKKIAHADVVKGYCVGNVVEDAKVMLIQPNLGPVESITSSDLEKKQVRAGDVGELIVSGPHVIEEYLNHPDANKKTKIRTTDGVLWHRTGDIAHFDKNNELYLVGRQKDFLSINDQIIFPGPIEAQLDLIPEIARSALVEINNIPTLSLEIRKGCSLPKARVADVLSSWRLSCPIHEVDHIPVDRRHNSKIDRSVLKQVLKGKFTHA